jgi:hypothetical protein
LLGDERRKHERRTVRYPAWIAVSPEQRANCVLADISEGGARIKVDENANIPDYFVLLFNPKGTPSRPCRVVWRKESYLGLKFEAPPPNAVSRDIFQI